MVVLILLVVILSVGRVVIANRLVEASEKMRVLDKNIENFKEANQNLSEAMRQPQSIAVIEDRAKALGFVKINRLVFLAKPTKVALQSDSLGTLR